MIGANLNRLIAYLSQPHDNGRYISFFCKGFYTFLLLKIFFLWPLTKEVLSYKEFTFNSFFSYFLFSPLVLTWFNINLFYLIFVVLLCWGLVTKVNFWTSSAICWFSISLSRLFLQIINGSDLVLNLFLLIAIFFTNNPVLRKESRRQIQTLVSNLSLIVAQIQIALIYLLSGYDKITSSSWRSGGAMDSINHLKFYHNPFISLELSETLSLLLSWSVILFELTFPILVWLKKFRTLVLAIGVLFHFGIAAFLGLVDFGLTMIICYAIFLPFKKQRLKGSLCGI